MSSDFQKPVVPVAGDVTIGIRGCCLLIWKVADAYKCDRFLHRETSAVFLLISLWELSSDNLDTGKSDR
jgi:hypothetical protein